jgi:hypothetical protein
MPRWLCRWLPACGMGAASTPGGARRMIAKGLKSRGGAAWSEGGRFLGAGAANRATGDSRAHSISGELGLPVATGSLHELARFFWHHPSSPPLAPTPRARPACLLGPWADDASTGCPCSHHPSHPPHAPAFRARPACLLGAGADGVGYRQTQINRKVLVPLKFSSPAKYNSDMTGGEKATGGRD